MNVFNSFDFESFVCGLLALAVFKNALGLTRVFFGHNPKVMIAIVTMFPEGKATQQAKLAFGRGMAVSAFVFMFTYVMHYPLALTMAATLVLMCLVDKLAPKYLYRRAKTVLAARAS